MRLHSESARFFVWYAAFMVAISLAALVLGALAAVLGPWVFPAALVVIPLLVASVLELRHRHNARDSREAGQGVISPSRETT
jgi:hypothetical protein